MINLMDKSAIIKLKEEGYSNRKIEKLLKINRKTVAKYWDEYKENTKKLRYAKDDLEIKQLQENDVLSEDISKLKEVIKILNKEYNISLREISKNLNINREKIRTIYKD